MLGSVLYLFPGRLYEKWASSTKFWKNLLEKTKGPEIFLIRKYLICYLNKKQITFDNVALSFVTDIVNPVPHLGDSGVGFGGEGREPETSFFVILFMLNTEQ